jgi:hypothetical protein
MRSLHMHSIYRIRYKRKKLKGGETFMVPGSAKPRKCGLHDYDRLEDITSSDQGI